MPDTVLAPMLSVAQSYLLANQAQTKLQKEAAKPDMDLRLLISHAHLLDSIIEHLSSCKPQQLEQQRKRQQQRKQRGSFYSTSHTEVLGYGDEDDDYDSDDSDDDSDDSDDSDDDSDGGDARASKENGASSVDYCPNSKSFFARSGGDSTIVYNVAEVCDDDDGDGDGNGDGGREEGAGRAGSDDAASSSDSGSDSEVSDDSDNSANSDFSSVSFEDDDEDGLLEAHCEEVDLADMAAGSYSKGASGGSSSTNYAYGDASHSRKAGGRTPRSLYQNALTRQHSRDSDVGQQRVAAV